MHQPSKCVQSARYARIVFLAFDCRINSEARSAISARGPIWVLVGRSGTMRSVGIRKRRLTLDTLPLSRVRTLLSSGNCHCGTYDVLNVLSSFGCRCQGAPSRLPNSNCQRRYTIRDAQADNPIEANARSSRADTRHQWNKLAGRYLPTAEPGCVFTFFEERR